MWTPIALNVAVVLIVLFLAAACMATLATVTTVALLMEVRAVWSKTFKAAIAEAARARRQRADCDQESAAWQAEKMRMQRDYEDLEREYIACTTSLREAREHVKELRLFYIREPKADEGSGV